MTTGFKFNPFSGNFDLVTTTLNVVTETTGPQVTHQLYVDGTRSDSYTADGSIMRPFKTIMAAVNQIITNGDNANNAAASYTILIAPASYNEDIVLNNALLQNIALKGTDQRTQQQTLVGTGSLSGYALDSSSSNTNLRTLTITNLSFFGNVRLQGDINNTNFLSNGCKLVGCDFTTLGNGLVLTNLGTIVLNDCSFTQAGAGATTVTNVTNVYFSNSTGGINTPLALITNGGNVPSDFVSSGSSTFVCLHNVLAIIDVTVDAGSYFMTRNGTRLGYTGGSLNITGFAQCYSTFIRSNITINGGGELDLRGTEYYGSLTNSGTVSNDGKIYYTPGTSSNWNSVPTIIKDAVDTLATSGVVKSQTTNKVLASPSGSSGVPSFRALVAADIPLISLTTGVSGILPIANGGTNASTKAAAFDSLSPMTTGGDLIYGGASGTGTRLANGTAGQVLTSQGTTVAPQWATPANQPTIVQSSSSGAFSTSSTSFTDVTNLSISVTANGTRPVYIAVVADDNPGNDSFIGASRNTVATATTSLQLLRGASVVGRTQCAIAGAIGNLAFNTPICFVILDTPAAGTYTYKVQLMADNASTTSYLYYCKLVAYQL